MSCVLPVCRWSFHSRTGSDVYLSAWSASQTLMTDGQCVADIDSNTEIKGKVLHVHVYYNTITR